MSNLFIPIQEYCQFYKCVIWQFYPYVIINHFDLSEVYIENKLSKKNSLDIMSLKAHFDLAYELAFSGFIIRFVDGILFGGS